MASDLWAVILAGGEDARSGTTALEATWHRATLLALPWRIAIVLTRARRVSAASFLERVSPGMTLIQPEDRGSAMAIDYALLRITARSPGARVVILPSDQWVSDDHRFMAAAAAAAPAAARGGVVALLGVDPATPEAECGWVESARPDAIGLAPVRRLWHAPPIAVARWLFARGALWNTSVIAGRATSVIDLVRRRLPAVDGLLRTAVPAFETPREGAAIERAYHIVPTADFFERVLGRSAERLAVWRVRGVAWGRLDGVERPRATA